MNASTVPPMWERRLVDAILRYRAAVLLVCLLLTGLAGYQARHLTFDSDIEIWFLEDDQSLRTYRKFLEQFQSDEIEVIGIFADDVFTPELLRAIDRITREAARAPYAHDVTSLSNAEILTSPGAFHVVIGRLMEEIPETAQQAAETRKRALGNVLVRDNLVNADGSATAIIVELDPSATLIEQKRELLEKLDRIVRRHLPADGDYLLSGSPTLDEAFYRYTERDFALLVPLGALVVIGICLALLRRVGVTLAALAVVTLAALWTFGLMGALGLKVNVISSSLMVLILAVGVADSIHIISDYYDELRAGKAKLEALAAGTAVLIVPCLFTSATTAAGFLSLLTSDLKPTGEFGWLAAVGVGAAFLLSVTFLPAVLSFLPAPKTASIRGKQALFMERLLDRLGHPTRKSSLVVLGLSGLLIALAVVGIIKVRVGVNPLNYFRHDDPVRQAIIRVDRELGGSGSFDLVINTRPEGLKDPEVLRRLDTLEKRLESLPGVTRAFSVLDSLRETRRLLTDGKPESAVLPDSRQMAAQLYLMLEGDEQFRRNVLGDYQTTRMTARVQFYVAAKLVKDIHQLQKELRQSYWDEALRIEPTGYVLLMSYMEKYMLDSQISSLLVAFSVITVMMILLMRSLRLGLFSLIPNLVPIALGLAFMAPAGIALDPGTVMIGSMALGLVVDDTVHFLVRLRRNLATADLETAIAGAMRQTGRPIIFTSLILSLGFLTLIAGSFNPNISFGLVSAVVIVLAVVADLVMLPAALIVFRPRLGRKSSTPASTT